MNLNEIRQLSFEVAGEGQGTHLFSAQVPELPLLFVSAFKDQAHAEAMARVFLADQNFKIIPPAELACFASEVFKTLTGQEIDWKMNTVEINEKFGLAAEAALSMFQYSRS